MNDIDPAIVAKYYIECELDNVVTGSDIAINEAAYSNDASRLLEALSFTFRANSVFDFVESQQVRWEEKEIPVDDIILTGMGEALTGIIYGEQVQQNPRKLIEYINEHPDDPRFKELAPRDVPTNRQTILLRQEGEQLKLLDGSHRFLSMLMAGAMSVMAYVAVPVATGKKPNIGEATVLRLRRLWQQTDDEAFREAIERTTAGIIRETGDGERAVRAYWDVMAPNETVRAVGRRLIDDNSQSTERSHLFKQADL